MERMTGVVSWFNSTKGYGFIKADNKDFFAHFKAINMDGYKELKQNQKVTFIGRKGEKGWLAEDIKKA